MKNREFRIFREDVKLPDVVNEKMDAAFRQIRSGQKAPAGESTGRIIRLGEGNPADTLKRSRRNGHFRQTAAAALCAALLCAGILTAAAAVYSGWSRGMKGTLQAPPALQKGLEESGVAAVLNEDSTAERNGGSTQTGSVHTADTGTSAENSTSQGPAAVTVNGVTIQPRMTVTTSDCAWVSFSVDGFAVEEGAQPDFGNVDVSFDQEQGDGAGWTSMNYSFYDGIVSDENGHPVYDDGTASAGPVQPRYADENGTMEFVIQMSSGAGMSFVGKTIHVRLKDLGTVDRASFAKSLEGTWEFTIPLSGSDAYRLYTAATAVGDTKITVKQLEISPVSIRASLAVPPEAASEPDFLANLTYSCGLRLKDGTMLTYLTDGGGGSFTDESRTEYRFVYPFDRVVDLDQVDALILRKPGTVEADGENGYYIIPVK